MKRLPLLALLLAFIVIAVSARVTRVEVRERKFVANGTEFGLAGKYEAIVGRVFFAVDPSHSANGMITDLQLAPKNDAGEVEFSADFHLLWPVDGAKGNRAVICEINNRGGKAMVGFFNQGAGGSTDPELPEHFGDGFLMERGYALLWVGWQFDVPEEPGRMRSYVPVAKNPDGSPIRGLARANIIVTDTIFSHSLADRSHVPYPVADPDSARNVMTVKDSRDAAPVVVPREKWRFARWEDGAAVTDKGTVYLEGGFQPNNIYDVVYEVENPPVVGLGMVAVRDMIAHLKHDSDPALALTPSRIDRAHGFGISQSGRLLRTFLYYGLNEDEQGRRVFDGVMAHVAGGGRGSFNLRFAQPSRDGHPFMNFLYPTDIFPFTDVVQRDPETGLSDGILARYQGREAMIPKIFYTNSSYEYWGRAASQIHTSIDAKLDIKIPDTTRVYHITGTQHGPGPWPPQVTIGQQRANPNQIRPAMRALLGAMDDWVSAGTEPPASRYGRVFNQTLVPPEELAWPKIPGVATSTAIQRAWRADYGPRFWKEGIVDKEPPTVGKEFPLLVPQVNADGNEVAGIRLPSITVPLATYTGWNPFNAKSGPTDVVSNMVGSYIPFPRTRAEAQRKGDPRKSIEERYRTREEYLGMVAEAAGELVKDRFLLREDVLSILDMAANEWQWVWGGQQ